MNNNQSFLFAPVNPKSISVFRILVALMITFMFSQKGLTPIYPLTEFPILCKYMFSDYYYGLIYLLILLFAIGIRPQIIAILLFIILLPHDFLIQGRKSKQVILCVLLCFGFIKSLPVWHLNKKEFLISNISPIWPIRLIQIQLTLLYGVNAIAKTTYEYLSGDLLIEMSKTYRNFRVDFSDGYYHLLDIPVPVFVLAIASTLIEYFLAIGFWFKKTRWFALVIGILFHLSLTQVVKIFMLDYVSMFLYLAFIIPFSFSAKDIMVRNN